PPPDGRARPGAARRRAPRALHRRALLLPRVVRCLGRARRVRPARRREPRGGVRRHLRRAVLSPAAARRAGRLVLQRRALPPAPAGDRRAPGPPGGVRRLPRAAAAPARAVAGGGPVRVLFQMPYPGYLRIYGSTVRELSRRGHEVLLAYDSDKKREPEAAIVEAL